MTSTAIPRLNVLPDDVNVKLFGRLHEPPTDSELKHLRGVTLDDTSVWDESLLLPLEGITPDSVEKMAQEQWEIYEKHILSFLPLSVPEKPKSIPSFADCWGEYYNGVWIPIEPEELPFLTVFDVETVPFAGTTNSICGSSLGRSEESGEMHWYAYRVGYRPHPVKELIPYRTEGMVIAHNASYDMAMLRPQYEITDTKLVALCTQSMGNMLWAISNQQEGLYKALKIKAAKGFGVPRWVNESCGGSLNDMHTKLFGYGVDKSVRDEIIDETWANWSKNIERYMIYNYEDVAATARLFQGVYPLCRVRAPHPATWMGMIHLSKGMLRVADDWFDYINRVDTAYQSELDYLTGVLTERAIAYRDSWLERIANGETPDDHLDWTLNKAGKNKGMPKWWSKVVKEGVTVKSRLAPLVAGVKYGGSPLRWLSHDSRTGTWAAKQEFKVLEFSDNDEMVYKTRNELVPLPHPTSTDQSDNVSSPFMEDFIPDMVSGLMTAADDFPLLSFTERFVALINWTMMRKRVAGVQVVRHGKWGNLVKPLAVVAGTQSRRCVDKLWLVAPGVKKERLGTELTGYVQAPEKGYKLVGADVDSEESWLATLVADSQPVREGKIEYAYPGYSQYSQIILTGDKEKGTDIHTLVAKMVNAPRNLAKNMNFACLPTDITEVHTPDGWKKWNQIHAGDVVYGYNKLTKKIEATAVSNVHFYTDAETINLSVEDDWKVECTPNHRWVDLHHTTGVKNAPVRRLRMVEAAKISSSSSLILYAPYVRVKTTAYSNKELALIAWLLTDGHITPKDDASIFQKKPEMVRVLNSILGETQERVGTGCHSWRLGRKLTRELRREDWLSLPERLSSAQLQQFLYHLWLADGNTSGSANWLKFKKLSRLYFTQTDEKVINILSTVAKYLGFNVTVTLKKCDSYPGCKQQYTVSLMRRNGVTGQRMKKADARTTDVFCLTTGLDTFVVRQNGGKSMITGNSEYGCGQSKLAAMVRTGSGCTREFADITAKDYLVKTRGQRHGDRYLGGLASDKFNGITSIISKPAAKTLLLKVQCPAAIDHYNTGKDFITTKGNWVIQSSGVDFLHICITVIHYLCDQYGVSARFATAIHDWLGFWVKDEDTDLFKKIMQTAHLLTKAYAHYQMGFDTMQLMGHTFSSVDVTKRLVKYPGNPCITPSNPNGFDPNTI